MRTRTLRRTAGRVVAAAAIASILAACGSSTPSAAGSASAAVATPTATSAPPTIAPTTAPSTSTGGSPVAAASLPLNGRIAIPDKGIAITLPPTWSRVDLGPNGMTDMLKAAGSQLPAGLQQMLTSQVAQMSAAGVTLFAFRTPTSDLPAGTTVNVLVLPNIGLTLDTYQTFAVGQLQAALGADTKIDVSRISAPVGDMIRLSYLLKVGTSTVGTLQYIFLTATKQVIISCGSPGGQASVQPECESIAKSLEIL